MLHKIMHRMTRLFAVVVCCTSTLFLAAGVSLRADPASASDRTEKPGDDAQTRTGLSEILQVGAKILGRHSTPAAATHTLPQVDAKGTSSSSVRKTAIGAMPLDHLSAENRQRVQSLLKSVSFYRRLPKVTFAVEPDVYNYFLAHPDTAVSIWRAMNISKLQMWQTGRYDYEADTGDGSVGTLEVLHLGPEGNLVFCDGMYKSPLFSKSIEAKSLLLLQTSFGRDAEGNVLVTHSADLFVSFPSQTIDVVARIFSPLTVAMTDRTFTEISLFLKMMSSAMVRRPDWVERITERMDGVDDIRKEQVLELSAQVHTSAKKRWLERIERSRASEARNEGLGQVPSASAEKNSASGGGSPVNRESADKPGSTRVVTNDRRPGEAQ
ncbi:MAG TPA: hypothetical protein VKU82_01520 [Planctomycetaceae bacterium]|nr:hypothetical protein [Planctomycetaceae bacterium]